MAVTVNGTNIVFNDATTQSTAFTGGYVSGLGGQVFTSSGTFTVPSGVTAVKVTVIGGGGNGGSSGNTSAGGGGGGGGMAIKYVTGLTPGGTVSVTVGGIAGTSSFGAYCSATGGASAANVGANTSSAGGAGGAGSSGDLNRTGTSGLSGTRADIPCVGLYYYGGVGGAANGSANSNGQIITGIGANNGIGSFPSSGIFGGGGTQSSGAANGYGNGGGGGTGSATGGAGTSGIVIVEW